MTATEHLTKEQVAEFKEAFLIFDTDGSNAISTSELGQVMKSLGQNPTDAELRELINEYDADGNGTLDFAEFLQLMTRKMKQIDTEEELVEAFKVFDRDGDGLIRFAELKHVFSILGEDIGDDDIHTMIKYADKDRDGSINFPEFCTMMSSRPDMGRT